MLRIVANVLVTGRTSKRNFDMEADSSSPTRCSHTSSTISPLLEFSPPNGTPLYRPICRISTICALYSTAMERQQFPSRSRSRIPARRSIVLVARHSSLASPRPSRSRKLSDDKSPKSSRCRNRQHRIVLIGLTSIQNRELASKIYWCVSLRFRCGSTLTSHFRYPLQVRPHGSIPRTLIA